MIIRKMIDKDIDELPGLYRQFWGEESSIEKMRDTFNKLKTNPDYIFLSAVVDNQLVGTVLGIICRELYGECKPFMVIEDFIVDENFRRMGIGRKLMNEIEKIAQKNNCVNIILVTERDRVEAISFYEAVGFNSNTHKGFKKSLKFT